MAEGVIHGPRAAVDLVVNAGIDASTVFNFQMSNADITPADAIGRAAARIGEANERLASMWGALWRLTSIPWNFAASGAGGSSETPDKVEFKDPDPVRGAVAGSMNVKKRVGDANGWSEEYLEDAFEDQMVADLTTIVTRWENRVNGDILRRIFSNTWTTVGAGYSRPWPTSASNPIGYVPPATTSGVDFDTTHNHFLATATALATAATAKSQLEAAINQITHHGIYGDDARFILMISQQDIAKWAAIAGYVKYVPNGVQVVAGNTSAPVYVMPGSLTGAPGQVIGMYMSDTGPMVEIRANHRIPANYAFLGVSFGVNDPRNPIAILTHRKHGFGMRVEPQIRHNPNPSFDRLLFKGDFGANVNNPLTGVALRFGNGTWANPTIGFVTE